MQAATGHTDIAGPFHVGTGAVTPGSIANINFAVDNVSGDILTNGGLQFSGATGNGAIGPGCNAGNNGLLAIDNNGRVNYCNGAAWTVIV